MQIEKLKVELVKINKTITFFQKEKNAYDEKVRFLSDCLTEQY